MAMRWKKHILLLPLFFLSTFARVSPVNRFGFGLGPFLPGFGFRFGEVDGDVKREENPDFETEFLGEWKVDHPNVGVAAMQMQLMPTGKVVWFDNINLGPSAVENIPPFCRQLPNDKQDCFAHGIEYDPDTSTFRTLKFTTDPWCSSGGLAPNGDLINTGGAIDSMKAVRILSSCENCEFRENLVGLADDRWYATQQILEDGSFIVVGGRKAFSYELIPSSQLYFPTKLFKFPFLEQTSDEKENNLYPFVYLLPDGNVFVFANSKSIIFNPQTAQILRRLPELPGGSRNYPPSAMSALLPLKLSADDDGGNVEAEVMVCGGNTREAAKYSEFPPRKFLPALRDCNRLVVNKEDAEWETEEMPSRRVMGDILHLPNGDLLMLNGAKRGTSAWYAAEDPNYTPVLYSPDKPKGRRMKELAPSNVARMYHAASALLPDGKILVAGSNPNQSYNFTADYPTELRVEKFSPPYLSTKLRKHRPEIIQAGSGQYLNYGQPFNVYIKMDANVDESNIKVTMYAPPFTTHGYSQNQRLLILGLTRASNEIVTAVAPPSRKVAPPGYYILFVVHRGVPSRGVWVHLQ